MVHQPALSALLGPIALLTPVPAQSVAQAASHLDQPLPAQHVHQAPIPIMQGPALVQCAPCAQQGHILPLVPLSALYANQAATQVRSPPLATAVWQAPIRTLLGPALVQCAPCAKQGRILSWVPLSALHASQAATQVQQPLHAPAAW